MPRQTITESEYEVMKVLWKAEKSMTTGEIYKELEFTGWSKNTVATLISRLCEKKVITYDAKGKFHYYHAVLCENDYSVSETKSFISKMFGGSVKNMVASLYENDELSKEDIEQLRAMLDGEK